MSAGPVRFLRLTASGWRRFRRLTALYTAVWSITDRAAGNGPRPPVFCGKQQPRELCWIWCGRPFISPPRRPSRVTADKKSTACSSFSISLDGPAGILLPFLCFRSDFSPGFLQIPAKKVSTGERAGNHSFFARCLIEKEGRFRYSIEYGKRQSKASNKLKQHGSGSRRPSGAKGAASGRISDRVFSQYGAACQKI